MPAKLPASLLKPPDPDYTLATMPVGSEFAVCFTAMQVDEDGSCYLSPKAKVDNSGFIRVRRDEDGYHVIVSLPGVSWTPKAIPEPQKANLIPVATVTKEKLFPERNET